MSMRVGLREQLLDDFDRLKCKRASRRRTPSPLCRAWHRRAALLGIRRLQGVPSSNLGAPTNPIEFFTDPSVSAFGPTFGLKAFPGQKDGPTPLRERRGRWRSGERSNNDVWVADEA